MVSALGRRDPFHDLMAGIFVSLVKLGLEYVAAIAKVDPNYSESPARIDLWTKASDATSTPPHFRYHNWATFEPLFSMVMNTAQGSGHTGYTGTLGGHRSNSSLVSALLSACLFFALTHSLSSLLALTRGVRFSF